VETLVELVGAALILSAFVLAQMGRLQTASMTYLVLNFLGAGTLAAVAAIDGDTGFLLLEGVWAVVSGYAILRGVIGGPSGRKGG
jgi:hypothetical protein